MTQTRLCGDPRPHEAHNYRRISEGRLDCPGHNNPAPEREPWYDCESGTASLCPMHAAAPAMLAALKEALAWEDGETAHFPEDIPSWTEHARAIINQAEGR